MRHRQSRMSAPAIAFITLTLAACGGGSSSGGSGSAGGGQTSTVVVNASALAQGEVDGMTRVAQLLGQLIVRDAEAVVTEVTVSGGELGGGRVFTTNHAGVVNVPLFGGTRYTFCVAGGCRTIFVPRDSVVMFDAETTRTQIFRAEDDEVIGDFAELGQTHKRIVCHKGRISISVAHQAVYDAHIAHGDRAGGCQISGSLDGDDPGGFPPPGNNDSDGGAPGMETICHATGNGGRTLTLPAPAARSHLGHGDSRGPCGTA